MKKLLLSLLVVSALMLAVVPGVFAASFGAGVDVDIETEDFAPLVWQCDHRVVYDDGTEPGRVSDDGQKLVERINNYAFEGEQIQWQVLVMDKNGKEKISDVYATVGPTQGEGNDIEVNCVRTTQTSIPESCNARILEEEIDEFDQDTMAFYDCTFTVETPESMYGEWWITVEAVDGESNIGTMVEKEFWFLNPELALTIDGEVILYNLNEEEVIASANFNDFELEEGADEDFTLDMLLSEDVNLVDYYTYKLYAKAYEDSDEDQNCNYDDNIILISDGREPTTLTILFRGEVGDVFREALLFRNDLNYDFEPPLRVILLQCLSEF